MGSKVKVGEFERKYTSTGRHSGYMVEMYHSGLNEVRHFSASDRVVLQGKVKNQSNSWDKKWQREIALRVTSDSEESAREQTKSARQELEAIEQILAHTLAVDDALDWNSIKNKSRYSVSRPRAPKVLKTYGEPKEADFYVKPTLLTILLGRREKHEAMVRQKYLDSHRSWVEAKERDDRANDHAQQEFERVLAEWENGKTAFEKQKQEFNQEIDELRLAYERKDAAAIVEYCELVLANSDYPDQLPRDFELQYHQETKILVVEYRLPSLDDIPRRASVRFVKTRGEFDEKLLSATDHKRLFESALYQITLRTIHELFEADVVDAIGSVVFNGLVTGVNSATGHLETSCVLSIQAGRAEFEAINLSAIDPKACFKLLKGVGSSKLSSITPVRPILELDKSDGRFRDHYAVASSLDSATNLAAMDWEDFEHLVREIFEKEFASGGGEVKVTRASSDGGVDAVAFDPDPIRGGKIVIQAKRYTNTVGVGAVRDLYGTVLNEGATKGILVTTSDYGADSYDFAKDKPITLLNGANLLHLLAQHGHVAKIDIKEARALKD